MADCASCGLCTLLFVELGANDGNAVAATVAGAPGVRAAAATLYATSGTWTPRLTCVHAFEPGPDWQPRLRAMEHKLSPLVAELRVHGAAAVADSRKSLRFAQSSRFSSGVGNSVLSGGDVDMSANSTRDVRAVNLISWLEKATSLRPRASVVVRMDAEGMEYHLLPALAASGLGLRLRAQGRRLVLVVEWHRKKRDAALADWTRRQGTAMAKDFLACFGSRSPWFSCVQPLARAGLVLLKDTPGSAGASANILFGGGVRTQMRMRA